jgi:hypothetical protein
MGDQNSGLVHFFAVLLRSGANKFGKMALDKDDQLGSVLLVKKGFSHFLIKNTQFFLHFSSVPGDVLR